MTVMHYEETEAAKLKQIATQVKTAGPGRGHKTVKTNSSEPFPKTKPAPQTRKKIAKQLNVSEHKVQQALNDARPPAGVGQISSGGPAIPHSQPIANFREFHGGGFKRFSRSHKLETAKWRKRKWQRN